MDQIKTNEIQQHTDIEEFSPLVKRIAASVAGRIPKSSMSSVDDLYQVGMMAVIEALPDYDATKGASVNTYIGARANWAMMDELRCMDPLTKSHRRRIRAGESDPLTWVSLTVQDTEDENEWSQKDLLDEHSFRMYPDPTFDEVLLMELQEQAYSKIKDSRGVFGLYSGTNMNFKDVGLVLGVSESRVSQLFAEATKHIRPLVN